MHRFTASEPNQAPHPADKMNRKRKLLWEIPSDLFCSLCGTCLDMDEQRMILKKLNIECRDLSDHDIHKLMVKSLYSENKLSRRLDSHLNNKYRYEFSRFGACDNASFMAAWREHMNSGNICGLYWVALTHKGLSDQTQYEVFCDVHMLSHLNGGKSRQEKRDYDRMLHLQTDLSAKLQQEKKKRKELTKALDSAEKTRRDLEARIQNLLKTSAPDPHDLAKANNTIDMLATQNQRLKDELERSAAALKESLQTAQDFKKLKAELESELWLQKEINQQLFREIDTLINNQQCINCKCSQADCCSDLCDKRVLIVGGLTKLRSFYRDVVENHGASFEYHDGYLKSGERELEHLIKKSDIILCPVDCNSHGACLSVKKICNRINKPYQMLASSSLSSISQALAGGAKHAQ